MKSKAMLITGMGCLGAVIVLGQTPAPQQGPGVQAPADARYPEWVMSKCKTPPPPRGGGRGAAAGPPAHREYAEGRFRVHRDGARCAIDPVDHVLEMGRPSPQEFAGLARLDTMNT